MSESFASALKKYFSENIRSLDKDFNREAMLNVLADNVGTFSDSEKIVEKIFKEILEKHDSFKELRSKEQEKIIKKYCDIAKSKYDRRFQNFVKELKKVFISRLNYSDIDHRLNQAYLVAEVIGEVSDPDKVANEVIDNLVFVFETKNNPSFDIAIKHFIKQNVGNQEKHLVNAATIFAEKNNNKKSA